MASDRGLDDAAIERRVLSAGVWLAVAGALLSAAASTRPGPYVYDLDPSGEGNVFSWASTVAAFGAAFAAGLHALVMPVRRWLFGALGGIFAFFSLDDMVTVHERLGMKVFDDLLGLPDNVSGQLEITLYAPLFAIALVLVGRLAREVPRRIATVLMTGAGLLAIAAAVELAGTVTRRLGEGDAGLANRVRIGFEEASELAGWVLVAAALTAILCASLLRLAEGSQPRPRD